MTSATPARSASSGIVKSAWPCFRISQVAASMICAFLRSLFWARFDTFGRSRVLLPVGTDQYNSHPAVLLDTPGVAGTVLHEHVTCRQFHLLTVVEFELDFT